MTSMIGYNIKIWKFADDTKICNNIQNEIDWKFLDITFFQKLPEDWQMLVNLDKCVVIYLWVLKVKIKCL